MKVSIGFNRHLEPDWLAQTASWVANGIEGQALKDRIDSMLEPAFTSKVAKDKTRNLLFGIWNKLPKHISERFQSRGANLLMEHSEQHLVFHWGMMLCKYPFFAFVVGQIGKLTKLNDTFIYSQLEDRVTEQYGDTSTIKRSMQFVVRTLMNLEVLKNPKQGVYELNTAISVEQPEVKGWLVEAIMLSNQSSSRSLSSINDDTVWFPFKLFFDLSDVQTNKELEAHLQSSDTVVFL
ncbi:hypothetical protein AB6D87_11890 [Vibrio lentus]|uniref:hypothetical protein n=1 Tax=Vibrio TaxID=662 RepID=UPI000C85D6DB|nr:MULTISPECIES: hypothetical protein [Vibrio]PMG55149.1 hypothetical protein BCU87_23950 [Vibrio lentus]TCO04136.1 hypothetical protein EDB51_10268 [Vibrio crassostreae]CAK2056311.1 Inner membrane protein DUF1819 [Vibrio crassostreae]CAK2999726.1 Inner membrane protein DUF1819 [Vibrio crassostreae]CAK3484888.1 Inner membrane protein DUF1819 [Vibrio crassostreae]